MIIKPKETEIEVRKGLSEGCGSTGGSDGRADPSPCPGSPGGEHRSPRGGAGDALLRLVPVIMKGSDDESARGNLGLNSENVIL